MAAPSTLCPAFGFLVRPRLLLRPLRFHPCNFDLPRRLFIQLFVKLHQPDVISQRSLHVVSAQLLFHALQQLSHNVGLRLRRPAPCHHSRRRFRHSRACSRLLPRRRPLLSTAAHSGDTCSHALAPCGIHNTRDRTLRLLPGSVRARVHLLSRRPGSISPRGRTFRCRPGSRRARVQTRHRRGP